MCSGDEFVSRKKLHTLFRGEEAERKQAGEIATMHNIYFFNDFMRQIREAIQRGMFKEFKEEFLNKIS
jgi:tRNA-guanine family transglycosylase